MDLSYILNHLGEDRETYRGAVSPPIYQSSIFAFPTVTAFRDSFRDEFTRTTYTRGNNPTVEILRKKVAALEGAEECLMFASGAGAVSAAVMASVSAGDHVVCVQRPYSWTRAVIRDQLGRFGVTHTLRRRHRCREHRERADAGDAADRARKSEFDDLRDAGPRRGRATGARTRHPHALRQQLRDAVEPVADRVGIDMVAHSATKYLNGHSDVVAGALCGSEKIMREVFRGPFMTFGAVLSPHDAWLMIRGLRTLPIRMQRIAQTAQQVLAFVEGHSRVERVYYPTAASNAQFKLAQDQMRGASGLMTLQLRVDDVAGVERFCNALQRFLMTVSWGGYESLLFPVCAVHPATAPIASGGSLPLNLVRLSIGLEEPDVLIADLQQALAAI